MIVAILIRHWRIIAAIVLVVALATSFHAVYRFGRSVERAEALKKSVEVLRERRDINAEIRGSDDAALCRRLGGVWNNGECV